MIPLLDFMASYHGAEPDYSRELHRWLADKHPDSFNYSEEKLAKYSAIGLAQLRQEWLEARRDNFSNLVHKVMSYQ